MTKHGTKNHTTNHSNSHYHEQHHHQTDVNAHHNKAITSVGSAEEGEEAFHEAAENPPLSDGGIPLSGVYDELLPSPVHLSPMKQSNKNKMDESNAIELLGEGVENFFAALSFGKKPWYLTTAEVYKSVKTVVASIPMSEAAANSALQAIQTTTELIVAKTGIGLPSFDVFSCNAMIQLIDTTIGELAEKTDDGLDFARAKASSALRCLIVALINYKNTAVSLTTDTATIAAGCVLSRYEQMLELTKALVLFVQEKYPTECDKIALLAASAKNGSTKLVTDASECLQSTGTGIAAYVENGKESVRNATVSTVTTTTALLLNVAQPYVQASVAYSTPIVTKAISYSQPYTASALLNIQPYVDAAASKAQPLIESKYVAGKVEAYRPVCMSAFEMAGNLLTATKSYAMPMTI